MLENIAEPVKICTAAEVQLIDSKGVLVVLFKANGLGSLEDATTGVAFHETVKLVDTLLRVHVESVALFKCCESSTSIVSEPVSQLKMQSVNRRNLLGSTVTLLVAELLASIGREEAFKLKSFSHLVADPRNKSLYSPTCSAFSQLRFIFDWLSGTGKTSSIPASSGTGPLVV